MSENLLADARMLFEMLLAEVLPNHQSAGAVKEMIGRLQAAEQAKGPEEPAEPEAAEVVLVEPELPAPVEEKEPAHGHKKGHHAHPKDPGITEQHKAEKLGLAQEDK